MSDIYELSYGEILRELRIYHGYKQRDLSEYLNITSQAYSNYENNKRTPDIDTIYKISLFYNITVDRLISYRFTQQFEEPGSYGTLFRGVSDSGVTIPMNAKQAKMVKDFLSLPPKQQETCQKFIEFIKEPEL